MNKSPIILFGNGEVPSHPLVLNKLESFESIICLDGGTDKLIKLGYKPTCIIGDLDSLAKKPEDYGCELITLPLRTFSEKMDITMLTNHSVVHCKKGKSKFRVSKGQLISILTNEYDTLIRTSGLEYELSNEKLLSPGNGISNIAISNHIEIDSNDWVWIFINHLE